MTQALSALVTMEMPCCSLKSSFPLSISKNVFVLHVWCQKHYTALSNSQLFSELLVDWWLPVVAGSIWTFVEQRRSSDLLSCRTMQTWGRRSHSPWGPREHWHSSCRHHWAWRRSKWTDSHQPLCSAAWWESAAEWLFPVCLFNQGESEP